MSKRAVQLLAEIVEAGLTSELTVLTVSFRQRQLRAHSAITMCECPHEGLADELEKMAENLESEQAMYTAAINLFTWLQFGVDALADEVASERALNSPALMKVALADYFARRGVAPEELGMQPGLQCLVSSALLRGYRLIHGGGQGVAEWARAAVAAGAAADLSKLRYLLRCQDILTTITKGERDPRSLRRLLPNCNIPETRSRTLRLVSACFVPPQHPRGAKRLLMETEAEFERGAIQGYLQAHGLSTASLLEEVLTAGAIALHLGPSIAVPKNSCAENVFNGGADLPQNRTENSLILCPICGPVSPDDSLYCLPNGRLLSEAGVQVATREDGSVVDPVTLAVFSQRSL